MWWRVHREVCADFWERLKEHFRAPSPIYDHANTFGHHASLDSFFIKSRESDILPRTIKEAMNVWVNDPSVTGTLGSTSSLDIWGEVLFNPHTSNTSRPFHIK